VPRPCDNVTSPRCQKKVSLLCLAEELSKVSKGCRVMSTSRLLKNPARRASPYGLRRRRVVCGVAAPRRCPGIACVAVPGIDPAALATRRTGFFSNLLVLLR
jgi:hypothetical protein